MAPAGSSRPIWERFWGKVEKSADPKGCWHWTASTNSGGYGQMSRGRGLAPTQSHIVSWTLHYGPVPAGMCVLHRCDVRVCVNPDHLFLGTRGDNGRDMAAKGRSPYGTRRWNARLTDDDIPLIRRLYRDGMGQTEIANLYGVKQGAIWGIVHGKTWRRVPDGSDDEARA